TAEELARKDFQDLAANGPLFPVIDEIAAAETIELLLESGGIDEFARGGGGFEFRDDREVDEEFVPEEPAGGGVGTRFADGLVEKSGEDREGADNLPALGGKPGGKLLPVREVSRAPTILGPRGVEGEKPAPLAGRFDVKLFGRRNEQRSFLPGL